MNSTIVFLIFILPIFSSYGAKIETLHKSESVDFSFKKSNGRKATFSKFLFLNGISLKKIRKEYYPIGNKRTRLQQHYMGIPIYGADVILHQLSKPLLGVKRFAVGKIVTNLQNDLQNVYASRLYRNEKKILNRFVEEKINGSADFQIIRNGSSVIIFIDDNSKAQLGYLVSCTIFYKDQLPWEPTAILNSNGEEIRLWDGIKYIKTKAYASGPGGNGIVGKYQYDGTKRPLLEVRREGEICYLETDDVKTVHNQWSRRSENEEAHKFLCPNQTQSYIHGGYSPLNDGHYYAGKVVEMFREWYGDFPFDEKPVIVHIHVGRNMGNAFYSHGQVSFGDGRCTMSDCPSERKRRCQQWYPTSSSADIVAHEFGHAVADHFSNMASYMGHSLHESFGDMTSMAFRRYLTGSRLTDWGLGSDVMKVPLRCMDNPKCDNASLDHCSQFNVSDWGDPHLIAGIFNKAFYLLAQKLPNDTRGAYDLFYCANGNFWYKNVSFEEAVEFVMKAAELFKDSGQKGMPWCINMGNYADLDVDDVKNAFAKVGFKCTKGKKGWDCPCQKKRKQG